MTREPIAFGDKALTFIGSVGAILIFALIIFVAYLPKLANPPDQAVVEKRQADADSVRAAGLAKLEGYEVLDKEAGIVRIPIKEAEAITLKAYR